MKQLLKRALNGMGFDLVRYYPPSVADFRSMGDLTEEQRKTISTAKPFTGTSIERMTALVNAVTYVSQNHIPGDIAECGASRHGPCQKP